MSLPHVLLVDDSDAVLAFEQAALVGHFAVSTASTGKEALAKAATLVPDLILLDLSMPEMDGGEALSHLKADPALRAIPVVVLSSEKARAAECLRRGAAAFLEKPVKPQELLATVTRVLQAARREQQEGGLAVLLARVGPIDFAVPLAGVRGVYPQMAMRPLPTAPPMLGHVIDLHGVPTCVLDLGLCLGVDRAVPLLDRHLVVVDCGGVSLALGVDRVLDPLLVPREGVLLRERVGGAELAPLRETLVAMVTVQGAHVPVLEPRALVSPALLALVPELLHALAVAGGPA